MVALCAGRATRRRVLYATRRELQVLGLYMNGYGYAAIAHELGISVRTVEEHLAALRRRYSVTRTSDLWRLVMKVRPPRGPEPS